MAEDWEMGFEVRSKQPDLCSHSSQTCIGPAGALPIQVKTSSLPLPQALPLFHPPSLLRMSLRYDGVPLIMVVVLPKEYIFLLTHLHPIL